MLDFAVALAALRKWKIQPCILVRGGYFEHRITGSLLRSLGAIPAGRGYGKEAIARARISLALGEMVMLAPEGHIPKQNGPQGIAELRPGVAVLAAEFGAHVLILGGCGTELIWNIERRVPRITVLPWKRPTIRLCTEWLHVPKGADVASVMENVRAGLIKLVAEAQQFDKS